MALKDYEETMHFKKINNIDEFISFCVSLLHSGKNNLYGEDDPYFEDVSYLLQSLDIADDPTWDGEWNKDSEYEFFIEEEELPRFLIQQQGKENLIPSEDEFPVIAAYYGEDNFDRFGNCNMRLLEFVSVSNIK